MLVDLKQMLLLWRAIATNLIFHEPQSVFTPDGIPGQGFNLLFTDNKDEFENVCIQFEKTLQPWVTGKWVSTREMHKYIKLNFVSCSHIKL